MADMKGLGVRLFLTVSVACLPALAQARKPNSDASIARGRKIAVDTCSTCHVVEADQVEAPVLKQPTPSFDRIANASGVTQASLLRFLGSTHWDQKTVPITMPNPMLTESQEREVVRYILSFRHQQ